MKKCKLYKFICPVTLCLILLLTSQIFAASPAQTSIEATINKVLGIIIKREFKNPTTRDPLMAEVEREITTIFDFDEFSARTVGPRWKDFSNEQKKDFIEAFSNLLRATYIDKLSAYNGEEIKFVGETSSTKGDKVEINTIVMLKDKPAPVNYRLLEKNSKWVVYDVNIEGVSLVQNYRTQFQDLLNKGTADELIKRVNEKSEETKKAIRK